VPRNDLIQVRSDTSANWTSVNPILATGEIGFETNTGKFKIGTGSTAWSSLPYTNATAGSATTAGTADKWTTARTITLAGDLTGSVSIDGSASVSLNATIAGNSVALGTDTTGNYMSDITGTSPVTVSHTVGEGSSATVSLAAGYGDTLNPYASKTAKYFLAAPNATAGVPTFRAIVATDIPTLNQNTSGSSGSCTGNSATASLAANSTQCGSLSPSDSPTINTIVVRDAGGASIVQELFCENVRASDSSAQFFSESTFTSIGLACARVENATTVYDKVVSTRAVYISSGGTLGTTASSRVFKENIVEYHDETNKLLTLNPVTFDFKDGILEEGDDRFNHFGLIAEDVHDAGLTHLVSYNEEGNPRAVDYTMISVELLGIVKKQQTAIDDLLARVQALESI